MVRTEHNVVRNAVRSSDELLDPGTVSTRQWVPGLSGHGTLQHERGGAMRLVGVECPECGSGTVLNGRGLCRCGAYLVHHWAGQQRGRLLVMSRPRTWLWEE